ncbi:hypothetical protein BKA66DRAFT_573931 [Pyrenochaeta sp. MPI-SDFR-AT-0127]|nr:hypothetical protein BKA66DRAFT_573931 [Pyrenochaeta sp. MPI-SDFR-AT-0127]
MANGSIGDVPAATFAEYVDDPFFEYYVGAGASQTSSGEEDEHLENAPSSHTPQLALAQEPVSASPCIALRPALTHRLYSHRLHVRAKAKLQRDRLLSGPMIDIYVGESKRHWSLHRNLLCHHSELLETELEGDADGSTRKERLDLPEHDPAGFELLVKWLYQGKLDDVSDMADANQKYDYAVSCHKLYLLCDRFDMPQLKNVAMDQYRKGLNEAELVPDAEEIDDIYRKSPTGSPFRQLMTRIAARQIMDPGSERDVETYRQCFENNPDFAVDLVKAIKLGTGGMLFEDPTDAGNECEYHDHDAGPNCHSKGKGRAKQVKKTPRLQPDPTSAKSTPSTNSGQRNLPRHLPQITPRPLPPRQARPQDGTGAGPLRRRLTSPASSTVGTSKETAVATQPPNPDMTKDREKDRERLRKVTPPDRQRRQQEQIQINRSEISESRPALDERLQSSDDMSRQPHDSALIEVGDENMGGATKGLQRTPSRRGIWEWARVGTGRLNIIGRLPHPEWRGSGTAKTLADFSVTGTPEDGIPSETQDDFSVPSATNTQPNNEEPLMEVAAAKIEGLGISDSNVTTSPSFSQTKRSSDELVAASSTASTPANLSTKAEDWSKGEISTPSAASKDSPPSTPETPTPQQRRRDTLIETESTPTHSTSSKDASHTPQAQSEEKSLNGAISKTKPSSNNIPSPHRIPKYKIALASNLLSPARTGAAKT